MSAGVATSVMPKLSVPDGITVRVVTPPLQQPAMSGNISIVPSALAVNVTLPDLTKITTPPTPRYSPNVPASECSRHRDVTTPGIL